jgi:hypothetical protein
VQTLQAFRSSSRFASRSSPMKFKNSVFAAAACASAGCAPVHYVPPTAGNSAEIVFVNASELGPALLAMYKSADKCEGRAILTPAVDEGGQRATTVPAGKPLALSMTGVVTWSKYSCLQMLAFSPAPGARYTAKFNWDSPDGSCSIRITRLSSDGASDEAVRFERKHWRRGWSDASEWCL